MYAVIICCIGCGVDKYGGSKDGYISLSLKKVGPSESSLSNSSICISSNDKDRVEAIEAEMISAVEGQNIADARKGNVKLAGPWQCSQGNAKVENVNSGNYYLAIFGYSPVSFDNADSGELIYYADKRDIIVSSGANTSVDMVLKPVNTDETIFNPMIHIGPTEGRFINESGSPIWKGNSYVHTFILDFVPSRATLTVTTFSINEDNSTEIVINNKRFNAFRKQGNYIDQIFRIKSDYLKQGKNIIEFKSASFPSVEDFLIRKVSIKYGEEAQ